MFLYPHCYTPTPEAQAAARELMARVRTYMNTHPDSELHTRGKMFGVLVANEDVLWAFSGLLDGSYWHEGFVEPVFEINPDEIVGKDREDSRRKQEWLFHQFHLLNARGEEKDLIEIFRDETQLRGMETKVPSGAGECCAPKLLQAAYRRGLKPEAMAEFWMGASPKDEIRVEGQFYPACLGKCRPILRHMLAGIEVEENPLLKLGRTLAQQTKIVYEDAWLIIVSKPSGLLSVPGKEGQYSMVDWLKDLPTPYRGREIYPCHRLDQDTSGLLIFAKDEQTYKDMQRLFFEHKVEKMYVAELESEPCTCSASTGEGVIELPLIANPLDRPRQMVDWQHGKRAVTRWEREGRRVRLYPETGRTHQLRVHCAHPEGLGTPILGDRLYGYNDGKTPLHLHACRIQFTHPTTGAKIDLSDYPCWW